jgi:hypothetical protein
MGKIIEKDETQTNEAITNGSHEMFRSVLLKEMQAISVHEQNER